MRFPLVVCFAMVVVAPLRADDVTDLISRCGKPTRDTRSSRDVRHLYYPGVHLSYLRTSDGGWNFNYGEVDGRGTILASTISVRLPCFQPKPLAADPVGLQPAASSTGTSSTLQMIVVDIFVLGILAIIVLAWMSNRRAWRNRPKRLCTNCYTLAQPLQHKNKRWYCGKCGADNPATLDSPVAQAFMANENAQSQVIESRNLP